MLKFRRSLPRCRLIAYTDTVYSISLFSFTSAVEICGFTVPRILLTPFLLTMKLVGFETQNCARYRLHLFTYVTWS